MNFEELGLTLKREREKKGLTIEVVMEATKISRTNIVAMENGDRSTLPHSVYTKGFVKSYARYLGLDSNELCMIVDREYQNESDGPEEHIYEVSPAAEKAFQEPEAKEGKRKSVWPLLMVLIFLGIVVVLLVMNLNGDNREDKAEPQVSTEVIEQADPVDPSAPERAAEETDQEMTAEAESEVDQAEIAASDEETAPGPGPKPEVKPEVKVEEKPVTQLVDEAPKPDSQKYDHFLVIRATTEKGCWIGLWKGDDTDMYRDYVLKQGEPLRLMFNSPRRIRIGNVSGVSVTYNGQPYVLDIAKGNIQTLRFGE